MASRVGVRELRQNLSVYLRRVAEGERFVVTDRREPVAELGPLVGGEDPYERWLRVNSLSRPKGDLLDFAPVPADPNAPKTLSELLQEDRDAHEL